jgi:hypothetical protein
MRPLALVALIALFVAGCSTLPVRSLPQAPGWTESRVGPFLVESSALTSSGDAAQSLRGLESRLRDGLELEADPELRPIRVLVFDDEEQLDRLMSKAHPGLPSRRAFFLAENGKRTIYAHRGDRLAEDLQHEATHALLHATVGVLPLWLDEGLAEYYEVEPDDAQEVMRRARALLRARKEEWSPDLARLESLTSVGQLDAADYREAWAWAHFLLEGPPQAHAILQARLDSTANRAEPPGSVSSEIQRQIGSPEALFWRHLEQIARPPRSQLARAQSPEPPSPAPLRRVVEPAADPEPRTFVGRLFDRLFNP